MVRFEVKRFGRQRSPGSCAVLRLLPLSVIVAWALPVAAQQPAEESVPLVEVSFEDVTLLQPADQDKPAVILFASQAKPEQRTRTVPVTKVRQETRTRIVEIDGKQVEQSYTVSVPFVENVEQTYTVIVRQPAEPTTVELNRIKAWNASGKPLSQNTLADRLSVPAAAFLLRRPWPEGGELEPVQQAVLREGTMFLYLDPANRVRP